MSVIFPLLFCGSILGATKSRSTVYDQVVAVIKKEPGSLAECQCLPGMSRDPLHLEESLRGKVDQKATQLLSHIGNRNERPTLFFLGSGRLLNETTILGSLMNAHISPRIVLIDRSYAFRIGKKIVTSQDTPKQLEAALTKFEEVVSSFSKTYGVNADIRIFYELTDALATVAASGEKISAFFLLDVFFPTKYSMNFLKGEISKGLKTQASSDIVFDSLFFFLGKKDPGSEMKFPVVATDKKPPTLGRDPAVLDIYQAHIRDGIVESEKLISQDIQ